MSSLQTMTAPSVGHNRPPDPGIDVASNSRSTSTTRTTNLTTTTSDAIPTSTGDNFAGREPTHPVEGDAPVDSSVRSEIDSRIETLPLEEKRPETTAETPTQSHSAEGPHDLPQKAPAETPNNAVSDEAMNEDKLVADKEGQKEEEEDSAQKGEQTTAEKGFLSVGNGISDNSFGEAEGRSTEMSTDNNKQLPTHDREKQAAATTLLVESLRNATATSQAGGPSSATPEWVPRTPLPEPLTDVSTPAAANEDTSLPPVNRQAEDSNRHQDTETNGNAGDGIVAKQENDFAAVTKELQDPSASQSNALFGQIHDDSAATTKIPDMVTGVMEDPLSKSNHEHSALFASFDMDGSVKPSSDVLQHPDLLSNAMLSNEISLSGLPDLSGYSNYDVAASTAGSEPRIQAFAKLEFDDGHFYVNTFSFVLGRDVRAARAAFQREVQVRQAMRPSRNKSSSGGNTSHTPNRVKRDGSAYMGSVVSDRGGIMGFDPDVPHHISQISRRSSVSSQPDSVLHATPAQLQANNTDYNALAMQSLYDSNADAKPVDMLALLPSPDACPTIPIHPPATADGNSAGHKGISRKHVKIAYNFDKNLFEMEVMGRNGAFIGADWLAPGQVRPLHSGDYIQIGGVRIRFLLPDVPIGETGADRLDEPVSEHSNGAALTHDTTEAAAGDVGAMDEDSDDGSQDGANRTRVTKLVLKTKSQGDSGSADAFVDNGESSQPKRRGPGRPPKDGIMSKRERAEIAREQKLAAKREANGGLSPPSSINRPKPPIPKQDSVEDPVAAPVAATPVSVKPAEKKSVKRKQPDGSIADVLIESIEERDQSQPLPEQRQTVAEYPKPPPPKKRKPSRSPSPDYPPESAYTPDQLAKPPYNYAVLIFDALTESRTPMTLKQIYRALKLKYPYFRFKCETEGWTSSVRHNLNGNRQLFEHAERDGKGWSWQLRAGASVEKEKKRRPSPPPPPSHIHQPSHQHYMPPPAHVYSNQGLQNQQFQFSALPSNSFNSAPQTPAFQRPPAVPAPPPSRPAAQVSTPNPFKGINLPPALMQRPASNYVSPYPCALPPEILQLQQQNQPNQNPDQRQPGSVPFQQHHQQHPPQFQQTQMPPPLTQQVNHHHQSHTQPHPPLPPQSQPLQNNSHQPHQPQQSPPSNFAPNGQHYRPPSNPGNQHGHYTPQPNHGSSSSPSQQHAPQSFQAPHQKNQQQQPFQQVPQQNLPQPVQPSPLSQSPPGSQFVSNHNNNNGNDMHSLSEQESSLSFLERANKAIDDFEAVLMEDYDDKNYIREVLKSARARALGHADKSSFPDGEPKDEVVLLDVLRNLIGSLKDE